MNILDHNLTKKTNVHYNDLCSLVNSLPSPEKKAFSNVFTESIVENRVRFYASPSINPGLMDLNTKSDLEKLYNILWECYLDGLTLNWFEKQRYETEKGPEDYSGFMVDLDIYQANSQRTLHSLYPIIMDNCNNLLLKYLNIGNAVHTTYVAIIDKPEMTKTVKDDQTIWKDGAHILYPGIHISKQVKGLILMELQKILQPVFTSFRYLKAEEAVDTASSYVPIQIYGNCRREKKVPHKLHSLHRINLNPINQTCTTEDCTQLFKYTKLEKHKTKTVQPSYDYNLCLELSIQAPGKLIKNKKFFVKKQYEKDLIVVSTKINQRNLAQIDQLIPKQVSRLINRDVEAYELSRYLDILNPERGIKYMSWFKICKYISRINCDYKFLAYKFSLSCSLEKWKKNNGQARVLIDGYFAETTQEEQMPEYDRRGQKSIAIKAIKAMAREDNLEAYKRINNDSIFEVIRRRTIEQNGELNDTDLADIVKILCNGQYVFCPKEVKGMRNGGFWYEYITEDKLENDGNRLYMGRWKKRRAFPKSLDNIIARDVSKYIGRVCSAIERYTADKDEKKQKAAKFQIKHLLVTKRSCGDTARIKRIKIRCEDNVFNKEDFDYKFDRAPNLLGVANGVIRITPKGTELISEATDIYCSRTCRTFYKPYDPEDKVTKHIHQVLEDMMPDKLCRDFILMWLSTSLVMNSPARATRYFGMIYSRGSSGKSILCKLLESAYSSITEQGRDDTYGHAYSTNAATFTNMKTNPTGPNPLAVNYRYARVVICPEGSGKELNMKKIKELDDGIPTRGLYEGNIRMKYSGVVIYATNVRPMIRNINYAVQRRIWYYRMPITFVTDEPKEKYEKAVDLSLKSKIERPEYGTAFLSILIHYYERMYAEYDGNLETLFRKCDIYRQTQVYINENNGVDQFINERLVKNSEYNTRIDAVTKAYVAWYKKYKNDSVNFTPDEFTTDFKEHRRLRGSLVEGKTSHLVGWQILSDNEYEMKQNEKMAGAEDDKNKN